MKRCLCLVVWLTMMAGTAAVMAAQPQGGGRQAVGGHLHSPIVDDTGALLWGSPDDVIKPGKGANGLGGDTLRDNYNSKIADIKQDIQDRKSRCDRKLKDLDDELKSKPEKADKIKTKMADLKTELQAKLESLEQKMVDLKARCIARQVKLAREITADIDARTKKVNASFDADIAALKGRLTKAQGDNDNKAASKLADKIKEREIEHKSDLSNIDYRRAERVADELGELLPEAKEALLANATVEEPPSRKAWWQFWK